MLITIYFGIILFMIGACLASFFAVAVERPMRGEKITTPASHCACGRPLKWYENIPVFGWLRIKGVTKCCNSTLPKRYVLTELFLGVWFAVFCTPFALFSIENATWGTSGWLALALGILGSCITLGILALFAAADKAKELSSTLE